MSANCMTIDAPPSVSVSPPVVNGRPGCSRDNESRIASAASHPPPAAATAADVTALQDFRDLFASDALRPGEQLDVGNLTVVFTDLKGSTRMYREIGDATALVASRPRFQFFGGALGVGISSRLRANASAFHTFRCVGIMIGRMNEVTRCKYASWSGSGMSLTHFWRT